MIKKSILMRYSKFVTILEERDFINPKIKELDTNKIKNLPR